MRHDLEYSVIVDRTKHGLGYMFLTSASTRVAAEAALANTRRDYPEYPAAIKVRVVSRSEWEDLPEREFVHTPEHVGGCNIRCVGDSHYLLAADTDPSP